MSEITFKEASCAMAMIKTKTGVVFYIAEMTVMRYGDIPSICYQAEISQVDVEITTE
jgi:hypothetical protein